MASKKFGPRTKEQRKQRSKKSKNHNEESNSNEAEILPQVAADARAERRQQLQDELRAEQGQMSSKKKKRLDKYIENKLKKEESLELLKKLALQNSDITGLQSSRNLGVKKIGRVRGKGISNALVDGSDESSEEEDELAEKPQKAPSTANPSTTSLQFGSGLKRPLERDVSGAPVIRKRQRVSMPTRFQVKAATKVPDSLERSSVPSSPETLNSGSEFGSEQGSGISEGLSEASWGGFSDQEEVKNRGDLEKQGSGQLKNRSAPSRSPRRNQNIGNDGSDGSHNDDSSDSDDSGDSNDSEDSEDDDSDEDDEEAANLAASMFAALSQARSSNQLSEHNKVEKRDISGFKEWATQQINEAREFAPNRALDEIASSLDAKSQQLSYLNFKPRPLEQDELPPELQVPAVSSERQAHAVLVNRPTDIQNARSRLPVVAEEQKIMEAIHNNPVTVVCGATGSGKTTQIPQFLFEAGFGDPTSPTPGMIAVTQPRRVAAVTMAQRVSKELGNFSQKVAYQIRYGSTVSKDTAIKFMTDGILIREIASDFKLTKYSAIVIDEAHERSVNTDILIGMLSRIVELRSDDHRENPEKNKPLKLIIMSATLMANAFLENARLFRRGAPPLVQSEGRQYPVTMHFARHTQREYVDETFRKVLRGHKKLPSGAILVFLTGENEIITLAKRLREALGQDEPRHAVAKVLIAASDAPLETDDFQSTYERRDDFSNEEEEDEDYDDDEEEDKEFEVEDVRERLRSKLEVGLLTMKQPGDSPQTTGALILPLYSKLPTKEQLRIFEPPPDNARLIVLATNVAETSITIPGVRYVFDCGRSKEKVYDQRTGVQSFEIGWISKASATQRAGRAGRTGPGHCYRLYSSAVFERDFADHTEPEILRMPVEGVVLQLKSMDLQHVVNFPFPTPPDRQQIAQAEKLLSYLGALNSAGKVTDVGRDLSIYPLSPRYAKMLAIGHQQDCMLLTIAMVAALATPELFISESALDVASIGSGDEGKTFGNAQMLEETARDERKKAFHRSQNLFSALDKFSDAIKLMTALGAYVAEHQQDPEDFCRRMFIRSKAAKEAFQLFQQLTRIVADNHPGLLDDTASRVPRPAPKQVAALKKIVAVGFIDQVAIRADLLPSPPSLPKAKRATDVGYVTLFPSHPDGTPSEERCVYVHASSVLSQRTVAEMPQYIVYSALQRGTKKVRMLPLTSVSETDLAALARGTPLVEYGKPLGKVEAVAGEPNKRTCWVTPSLVGKRGTTGWPLREQKVLQRRIRGNWEVEKVAI